MITYIRSWVRILTSACVSSGENKVISCISFYESTDIGFLLYLGTSLNDNLCIKLFLDFFPLLTYEVGDAWLLNLFSFEAGDCENILTVFYSISFPVVTELKIFLFLRVKDSSSSAGAENELISSLLRSSFEDLSLGGMRPKVSWLMRPPLMLV